MNISYRLGEQMKIRKMSIPGLSEKTGISENTIKNYLYRGQEPRAEAMLTIANALNISAAYLRGETDDPEQSHWEVPHPAQQVIQDALPAERRLVQYYRRMNEQQQDILLGWAANLAGHEK